MSERPDRDVAPTRKNPWLVWLAPIACSALAFPLGAFFGTTHFRAAPTFACNLGLLLFAVGLFQLLRELAAFTGQRGPVFWHGLLPFYNLYWAATVVRPAVAHAKEKAGKPPARGALVYALALPYALAADVNDLVGAPKIG